jgi:hypothetical protein
MFATEINEKTMTNTTGSVGGDVETLMKKFTPRSSTLSTKLQAQFG